MSGLPKEIDFEKYIVDYLTSQPIVSIGGEVLDIMEYHQIANTSYDREICLVPSEVIAFLKDTQPKEYQKLINNTGGEAQAQRSLLERLDRELSVYKDIKYSPSRMPLINAVTNCFKQQNAKK